MGSYLFVVAHNDDEILGAGGTMQKLIAEGNEVSVCCMTNSATTREKGIPETMIKTHGLMGVLNTYSCNCEAMEIVNENHFRIVDFIEKAMIDCKAEVIVTHSKKDVHPDHRIVHDLVMEAFRLPQRGICSVDPVKAVYTMEIPCSSSWGNEPFAPDTFVEISKDMLDRKVDLTKMYHNVIRKEPHPRSERSMDAIARFRGMQSGYLYAEAFETVFRLGM